MWGRVVALGVVLLLVFFLGRASAGDGSSDEVETLQNQLAAARAQIDQLEAENRQRAQAPPSPIVTATATPTTTATPRATPSPTGTGGATAERSYTVRSGDTLRGLAGRFYGNSRYDQCIAQANNIPEGGTIRVGQDLRIPPKPPQPCT